MAPRRPLGQDGRVALRVPVKGKQIYVEGKLQTRQWDDKDGNKRYTTEVRGDRVVLLAAAAGAARRAPAAARAGRRLDGRTDGRAGSELTDDDIPF